MLSGRLKAEEHGRRRRLWLDLECGGEEACSALWTLLLDMSL